MTTIINRPDQPYGYVIDFSGRVYVSKRNRRRTPTLDHLAELWLDAVETADDAEDGLGPMDLHIRAAKKAWAVSRLEYPGWAIHLDGARTLAGALVPLLGPAPSLVNFTTATGVFDGRTLDLNGVDQIIDSNFVFGDNKDSFSPTDIHIAVSTKPFAITPNWDRVMGSTGGIQCYTNINSNFYRGQIMGPVTNWTSGPTTDETDGLVFVGRDPNTVVADFCTLAARSNVTGTLETGGEADPVSLPLPNQPFGIGGYLAEPVDDICPVRLRWASTGPWIDPAVMDQWDQDCTAAIDAALA